MQGLLLLRACGTLDLRQKAIAVELTVHRKPTLELVLVQIEQVEVRFRFANLFPRSFNWRLLALLVVELLSLKFRRVLEVSTLFHGAHGLA